MILPSVQTPSTSETMRRMSRARAGIGGEVWHRHSCLCRPCTGRSACATLMASMGALYREFERSLEEWSHRFAGKPRDEMIHLFLLALEREEIVAVSYRE